VKIKPCYTRKIVLNSIVKAMMFTAHAHVSRDLCCIGGPSKPHAASFFTPNWLFTMQLLWGFDDDVKVVSVAKNVQSKSVPKVVAFGNLRM